MEFVELSTIANDEIAHSIRDSAIMGFVWAYPTLKSAIQSLGGN